MNKLLTDSVREVLQSQYPDEDLVEIDGCIYHLPHTEEAWAVLRDKVRPGWAVMQEPYGLKHYVMYNPEYYAVYKSIIDYPHIHCCKLVEDIELPINCSSCNGMFDDLEFPDGFTFQETFDTSEVMDMYKMFESCRFMGDINLGVGFKTDKVENFVSMFSYAEINGILDLGCNFSLENAETLEGMFSESTIEKPIKFRDKFNPRNVLYLDYMFGEVQLPKGFNIGNNFHVRKGASLQCMFCQTKFNDDFWLPDCFNIDRVNDCDDMFDGAELPKRVRNKDTCDVQEIINGLKVR